MTDAAFQPSRRAPVRRITLHPLFGAEPVLAGTGILIGLSLAVTAGAMVLDSRAFQGEDIWTKPIKFQVALAVYTLTLAFFARWLPQGMTKRRDYRLFAGLVVVAVLAETAWIGGAAMFGTASHFNVGTPFKDALYATMGVLAVMLTTASLVYGIAIGRNTASGLQPAMRLAIALGLVLTFVLTIPVAGYMASTAGHLVGTPALNARVPVMGWSLEVGDLRVAHFFATHALHFLPAAGLIAVSTTRGRTAGGPCLGCRDRVRRLYGVHLPAGAGGPAADADPLTPVRLTPTRLTPAPSQRPPCPRRCFRASSALATLHPRSRISPSARL